MGMLVNPTVFGGGIVTSGLVVHLDAGNSASYPGSGTTWYDLSGNGYNGTLVNSPTYSSGEMGSLYFDGTERYINLGSTYYISTGSAFTINTWFKWVYRDSVFHRISTLRASGTSTLGLGYAPASAGGYYGLYMTANNGWARLTSSYTITSDVWGMLTLTYNGSGSTTNANFGMYWNTSTVSLSSSGTSTPAVTTDNNYLCTRQPSDTAGKQYFKGYLSIYSIYNRQLSAGEISQNFNAIRGRYGV